jgi:hypothetical protein
MPSFRKSYSGPSNRPMPVVPPAPAPPEVEDLEAPVSLAPEPESEPVPDIPTPPPPAPAPTPDFTDVRNKEDTLNQLRVVAKAGDAVNAAFVRRRPDPNAGAEMDRANALNKSRFAEDFANQKLDSANGAAREASDPNSATNRQFRMTIRPLLGDRFVQAVGPAFDRLTKAQIEQLMPSWKLRADQDAGAAKLAAEQEQAKAKAAQSAAEFEETKRHNAQTEQAAWTSANRVSTSEGASDGSEQDGIADRFGKNKIYDLSKFMEGVAPTMRNYMRLEQLAPGLVMGKVPQNIENWDQEQFTGEVLRKFGGRRLANNQVEAINQTVNDIAQQLRHDRYGAALTPQEAENWLRVFDTSFRSGPEAQAIALNAFRQNLGARVDSKLAYGRAFEPEKLNQYLNEFGMSAGLPLFTHDLNPLGEVRTYPNRELAPSSPTNTPAPARAPATPAPTQAGPPQEGEEKVLGGVKYVFRNGDWYQE